MKIKCLSWTIIALMLSSCSGKFSSKDETMNLLKQKTSSSSQQRITIVDPCKESETNTERRSCYLNVLKGKEKTRCRDDEFKGEVLVVRRKSKIDPERLQGLEVNIFTKVGYVGILSTHINQVRQEEKFMTRLNVFFEEAESINIFNKNKESEMKIHDFTFLTDGKKSLINADVTVLEANRYLIAEEDELSIAFVSQMTFKTEFLSKVISPKFVELLCD
ncbi:MAG: hypothetical protein OHK0056_22250 [Bacteriovoracaceae bacterium]